MALGYLGVDKSGHSISQVYCDLCAREEIYPMLHQTLYKIEASGVVLCEFHAIAAGKRAATPGFYEKMGRVVEKARRDRAARDDAAKVPRPGRDKASGGIPEPEKQSGTSGGGEDKQSSGVEYDIC